MRFEVVKAAVEKAPACALGHWYNSDELCTILDIEKSGFEALVCGRYLENFATSVGLDYERLRFTKRGPYITYFYLRRNLQPPTTSMRSIEERSKRPDFDSLCREVRRARRDVSSAGGCCAGDETAYSLRTPVLAPPGRTASPGPPICDEIPPMTIDGPGSYIFPVIFELALIFTGFLLSQCQKSKANPHPPPRIPTPVTLAPKPIGAFKRGGTVLAFWGSQYLVFKPFAKILPHSLVRRML